MGRSIVAATPASAGPATRGVPDGDAAPTSAPADQYGDRLMKLIPGEVITLYLSLVAMLDEPLKTAHDAGETPDMTKLWVVLALCAGGTLLYLRVAMKVKDKTQLAISVGAFFVWAFAIGGPFRYTDWYDPFYAGVAVAAFTFAAPLFPMGGTKK
jgi:hypothetical protein